MKKNLCIILILILISLSIYCLCNWNNLDEKDSIEIVETTLENPIENTEPTEKQPDVSTPIESEFETETLEESEPTEEEIQTNLRDAIIIAKVIYGEARGISSITEQACIAWTILNRVDYYGSTVEEVVTAPNQFAYDYYAPTTDDYERNLIELSKDVLKRWTREKRGEEDIGRVLPKEYMWYAGDGVRNYFRDKYIGGNRWDYSLESPYEEEVEAREEAARWAIKAEEYPVATQVWLFMKEQGWSDAVCAGILGNMMTECGGHTMNLQWWLRDYSGWFYGICQWHKGFFPEVQEQDLEYQLQFLVDTMGQEFGMFGSKALGRFLAMTDPAAAALDFAKKYERCAETEWNYTSRQNNAWVAYNYFTN